jgi:hypothetical protein
LHTFVSFSTPQNNDFGLWRKPQEPAIHPRKNYCFRPGRKGIWPERTAKLRRISDPKYTFDEITGTDLRHNRVHLFSRSTITFTDQGHTGTLEYKEKDGDRHTKSIILYDANRTKTGGIQII